MPIAAPESVQDIITRVARELGVDPQLALAIAQQESGFDPNVIGDGGHSVGLFQLNDRGEGAGMSVQARQDPETNARIALTQVASVAQAHPDWSPGTIAAAAQRPLDRQGYAKDVDAIYGGGAYQPSASAGGGGGGPVGTDAPAHSYRAPAGGTVLTINGGYATVIYQVGPNTYLQFKLDANVDTTGLGQLNVDPDQYQQMAPSLHASGSAQDLDSIASSWKDFNEFWNHLLDTYLGPNSEARNDPGVIDVIARKAARPDMSDEELQNLLKGTDYWKSRTDGQLAWNDLSPAEQQKKIADIQMQLRDQFRQLVGHDIALSDGSNMANLLWWSTAIANGSRGLNEAVYTWIQNGVAAQDPQSPWSRTQRNEQENERQRGVDVSNSTEQMRQTAAQWGVKLDDQTLARWGQDVVEKTRSDADFVNMVRGQAQILYPWMKQLDPQGERSVQDLATPWLQTYQRVMEKPADIFNPDIQRALTNGTPVWQMEQDLKKRPEWLQTKNAQDDITGAVGDIGRRMGFS